MSAETRGRWSLTHKALDRLLNRLNEHPQAAAQEYESLRRRLITFFAVRGIDTPDALADETFDRVARRLDEGEHVEHLRAYFQGVAQRVALEWDRRRAQERAAVAGHRAFTKVDQTTDAQILEDREERVACLERCLEELPRESRLLIQQYYKPGGLCLRDGRKALACRLGINYSSLKVRVYRIRGQLERCVRQRLEQRAGGRT